MTKKVCIITRRYERYRICKCESLSKRRLSTGVYGSKEETVTNALKNLNYDNVEGRWINLNDEKLVNEDFNPN